MHDEPIQTSWTLRLLAYPLAASLRSVGIRRPTAYPECRVSLAPFHDRP